MIQGESTYPNNVGLPQQQDGKLFYSNVKLKRHTSPVPQRPQQAQQQQQRSHQIHGSHFSKRIGSKVNANDNSNNTISNISQQVPLAAETIQQPRRLQPRMMKVQPECNVVKVKSSGTDVRKAVPLPEPTNQQMAQKISLLDSIEYNKHVLYRHYETHGTEEQPFHPRLPSNVIRLADSFDYHLHVTANHHQQEQHDSTTAHISEAAHGGIYGAKFCEYVHEDDFFGIEDVDPEAVALLNASEAATYEAEKMYLKRAMKQNQLAAFRRQVEERVSRMSEEERRRLQHGYFENTTDVKSFEERKAKMAEFLDKVAAQRKAKQAAIKKQKEAGKATATTTPRRQQQEKLESASGSPAQQQQQQQTQPGEQKKSSNQPQRQPSASPKSTTTTTSAATASPTVVLPTTISVTRHGTPSSTISPLPSPAPSPSLTVPIATSMYPTDVPRGAINAQAATPPATDNANNTTSQRSSSCSSVHSNNSNNTSTTTITSNSSGSRLAADPLPKFSDVLLTSPPTQHSQKNATITNTFVPLSNADTMLGTNDDDDGRWAHSVNNYQNNNNNSMSNSSIMANVPPNNDNHGSSSSSSNANDTTTATTTSSSSGNRPVYTTEDQQFLETQRQRLLMKAKERNIEIPPFCSCGVDPLEKDHTLKCCNNCEFYRNPRHLAQIMTQILNSL